jgi:predicted esterase
VHGDSDSVVEYSWGKASHDLLKHLGLEHQPRFMTIEVPYTVLLCDSSDQLTTERTCLQDMGHSSDPEEMATVKAFLHEVFAK